MRTPPAGILALPIEVLVDCEAVGQVTTRLACSLQKSRLTSAPQKACFHTVCKSFATSEDVAVPEKTLIQLAGSERK